MEFKTASSSSSLERGFIIIILLCRWISISVAACEHFPPTPGTSSCVRRWIGVEAVARDERASGVWPLELSSVCVRSVGTARRGGWRWSRRRETTASGVAAPGSIPDGGGGGGSVRARRACWACVRSRTPIRVGRRDVRTPSNGAAARDVFAVTSIIILAGAPEATLVAAAGRVALHSVCHTRSVRSAALFL